MPYFQLETHGGAWSHQPLGEPGQFTTIGVAQIRQKIRQPTLKARLETFHKAKDNALQSANLICTTNPDCSGVDFVKYVNLKEYGFAGMLMLELTVQWHCK